MEKNPSEGLMNPSDKSDDRPLDHSKSITLLESPGPYKSCGATNDPRSVDETQEQASSTQTAMMNDPASSSDQPDKEDSVKTFTFESGQNISDQRSGLYEGPSSENNNIKRSSSAIKKCSAISLEKRPVSVSRICGFTSDSESHGERAGRVDGNTSSGSILVDYYRPSPPHRDWGNTMICTDRSSFKPNSLQMEKQNLSESLMNQSEISEVPESLGPATRICRAQHSITDRKCANDKMVKGTSDLGSMNCLPLDLLQTIFDKIVRKTKRHALSISREWRTFSPAYRKSQTSLRMHETSASVFPLRDRGYTALTSVIINHSLADDPLPVTGEVAHRLTDAELQTLATEFPTLERLELISCDLVTPEGLLSFVQTCPGLRYLHVQACPRFDDEGILAVVRACTDLQELRLAFCEVSALGIEALRELTTVTTLGCPLSQFPL